MPAPTTITMTGPGSVTIDETAVAAAITANATSITGAISAASTSEAVILKLIQGTLAQINGNLADIHTQSKLQTKALSDIDIAMSGMASATSRQSLFVAAQAASVIQKNNFDKAVVTQGLLATGQEPPVMPAPADQLKEGVVNAGVLSAAATATGAATQFISEQMGDLKNWITNTEAFKSVKGFVSRQIDTILSVKIPDQKAEISKVNGSAGNPVVPPNVA